MGKGNQGGKRNKKKNNRDSNDKDIILAQQTKDLFEVYGLVTKELGSNHLTVECSDNKIRRCLIRGKLRKRVWIKEKNIVLVEVYPNDPTEGMIKHKYNDKDARYLHAMGLIKFELTATDSNDCGYNFEMESDDSDSDSSDENIESIKNKPNTKVMANSNIQDLLPPVTEDGELDIDAI